MLLLYHFETLSYYRLPLIQQREEAIGLHIIKMSESDLAIKLVDKVRLLWHQLILYLPSFRYLKVRGG